MEEKNKSPSSSPQMNPDADGSGEKQKSSKRNTDLEDSNLEDHFSFDLSEIDSEDPDADVDNLEQNKEQKVAKSAAESPSSKEIEEHQLVFKEKPKQASSSGGQDLNPVAEQKPQKSNTRSRSRSSQRSRTPSSSSNNKKKKNNKSQNSSNNNALVLQHNSGQDKERKRQKEHKSESFSASQRIPVREEKNPQIEKLERSLYVGNLALDLREPDLKKYFEKFGRVEQVLIISQNSQGQPLRDSYFGFVTMQDRSSCELAIANFVNNNPQNWRVNFRDVKREFLDNNNNNKSRSSVQQVNNSNAANQKQKSSKNDNKQKKHHRSSRSSGSSSEGSSHSNHKSRSRSRSPNNQGSYYAGHHNQQKKHSSRSRSHSKSRQNKKYRSGGGGLNTSTSANASSISSSVDAIQKLLSILPKEEIQSLIEGGNIPPSLSSGINSSNNMYSMGYNNSYDYNPNLNSSHPNMNNHPGNSANFKGKLSEISILVRELWIGGLPTKVQDQQLGKIMDIYGEIESLELFDKPPSNFAYVKFMKVEDAAKAFNNSQNISLLLDAPTLKIQYADHLRRSHIVGNSFGFEQYDDLTPIMYIGYLKKDDMPSESSVRRVCEKYSDGKPIIEIVKKSIAQTTLRGYFLVLVANIETAIQLRKKLDKQKEKLGDAKCQVSILLNTNKVQQQAPPPKQQYSHLFPENNQNEIDSSKDKGHHHHHSSNSTVDNSSNRDHYSRSHQQQSHHHTPGQTSSSHHHQSGSSHNSGNERSSNYNNPYSSGTSNYYNAIPNTGNYGGNDASANFANALKNSLSTVLGNQGQSSNHISSHSMNPNLGSGIGGIAGTVGVGTNSGYHNQGYSSNPTYPNNAYNVHQPPAPVQQQQPIYGNQYTSTASTNQTYSSNPSSSSQVSQHGYPYNYSNYQQHVPHQQTPNNHTPSSAPYNPTTVSQNTGNTNAYLSTSHNYNSPSNPQAVPSYSTVGGGGTSSQYYSGGQTVPQTSNPYSAYSGSVDNINSTGNTGATSNPVSYTNPNYQTTNSYNYYQQNVSQDPVSNTIPYSSYDQSDYVSQNQKQVYNPATYHQQQQQQNNMNKKI